MPLRCRKLLNIKILSIDGFECSFDEGYNRMKSLQTINNLVSAIAGCSFRDKHSWYWIAFKN